MKNALILFAKYPEPGKVKTRLAKEMGAKEAAEVYKKMVEKVMEQTKLSDGEYQRILYYDPPESHEKFSAWLGFAAQRPQHGEDLGERMKNALAESLTEAKRVVLIGTDCLDVDQFLILKAFNRLDEADLILGPAKDGGYYLIGCKKVYPELFSNMEWSTERVLSQTLKIANDLKLSVSLLPELEDIDTTEQLCKRKNTI